VPPLPSAAVAEVNESHGQRPSSSSERASGADRDPVARALARFPLRLTGPPEPFGSGLINATYLLRTVEGRSFVLQRVNPIFPAVVQEDIAAVTEHLAARGVMTCRLVPARDGRLWADLGVDGTWRILTFLPGQSLDSTSEPGVLRSAAGLVARFHRALADLAYDFRSVRPGFHDTPRHLGLLRDCLTSQLDHPRFPEVSALAGEILDEAERLPRLPATPPRVIHGDLKLNNVRFSSSDPPEALALLDLDTLGRGPLPLELGDALRSWCNPAGENAVAARFDLELFEAAVAAYASEAGFLLTADEAACLPAAVRTIALELAARFCRDALEERYFGWDASRFGSASEHNELRARSQLVLSRSVAAQDQAASAIVARALRAAPRS
jgi:Ser/Thr protein kinase RdoA (MazF antagonist)